MTEKPPDIGNNWVAACVAMWSNTMPKEEIIELMVKKFDIRLMEEMSKRINSFEEKLTEVGEKKIVMSLDGVSSTMADRLYEKVLNLKFKVVFYVPFADLSRVPGVKTDSPAAECAPAVSARLSVVEQRTEDIYEMLRKMANRPPVPVPAAPPPTVQVTPAPGETFSSVVAGGGGAGLRSESRERRAREASEARRKRDRAEMEARTGADRDGFQPDRRNQRKSRHKGVQGTRTIAGQRASEAVAPVDIYIGNTGLKMTEDKVKELLIEFSKDMPEGMKLDEDLEIEEVVCLTKPRDGQEFHPWCLNWRVRVPGRFKDHMLRPESIPSGWTTRRYFPPRQRRQEPEDMNQSKRRMVTSQLEAASGGSSSQQTLPVGAHYKSQ